MQIKIPTELFRAPGRYETLIHEGSVDGPWTTHVLIDITCDWPSQHGPQHLHVNSDVGHMAAGLDDHIEYLQRLAARGERDES